MARLSRPISPIGPWVLSVVLPNVPDTLGRRYAHPLASHPNNVGSGSEIMLWWVRKLSAMT
jgi:hypothetical protein